MLAHSRGSGFIYEGGGIMDISQVWEFIRQTWRWWVAFSVCAIVGYCLWYHLFGRRIYKKIDGKMYVISWLILVAPAIYMKVVG